MLTTLPSALVVPASLGVNNVADFLALLKKGGPALRYASIGVGSLSQLTMEAIAQKAGVKLIHIPYPGSPQAMVAIANGDVEAGCLPASSVVALAKPARSRFWRSRRRSVRTICPVCQR